MSNKLTAEQVKYLQEKVREEWATDWYDPGFAEAYNLGLQHALEVIAEAGE